MASTNNLQATINWAAPHLNYQPLTIGGMEPALSTANIVMQTILGPPFCWRWNRATGTFVCTGVQDYSLALPTFGFIEKAWLQYPAAGDIKELAVRNALSATKDTARPEFIAAQGDDGAGDISFRLMQLPDVAYTVSVLYQQKPLAMTSLASTWGPIPDEYAYIYNWGFLALSSIVSDDPRFPIFNQKFLSHLLGAQDGLDEMQKNLFLGQWMEITKALQRSQEKVQQGNAARQN